MNESLWLGCEGAYWSFDYGVNLGLHLQTQAVPGPAAVLVEDLR